MSFIKGLSCNHSSMLTPIFIPEEDEKADLLVMLESLLISYEDEIKERKESEVKYNKREIKKFWNHSSYLASQDLWFPTEDNYFISNVSTLPVSQSWFSVTGNETFENEKKYHLPEFKSTLLVSDLFKTVKIRVFPDKEQRRKLKRTFGASRWAYNTYLDALKKLKNSPLYSEEGKFLHKYTDGDKIEINNIKTREFIRSVKIKMSKTESFKEEIKSVVEFIYHEEKKEFPFDDGWTNKDLPVRASRGVVKNLVQNINSLLSNKGNLEDLNSRKLKGKVDFVDFDDWATQGYIVSGELKPLKGHYKIGRRKIRLEQLIPYLERKNFQLRHEKDKDHYFLILPVTLPCYEKIKNEFKYTFSFEDKKQGLKRLKNQEEKKEKYKLKYKEQYQKNYINTKNKPQTWNENQISSRREFISLDPGVRTFQTGYALDHTISMGENNIERLHSLLKKKDIAKKKVTRDRIQRKITYLVNELHWKTISYLTLNYKRVMIPEFNISQMVKGKKINKKTKRALYVFKFYQFKQRLINKGKERDCSIEIVTEEYTSKTCGRCGTINEKLGGSKKFECGNCGLKIDRDLNGARNILIKNLLTKEEDIVTRSSDFNGWQESYVNVIFTD